MCEFYNHFGGTVNFFEEHNFCEFLKNQNLPDWRRNETKTLYEWANDESVECAVVRVQQETGDGTDLTGPVPAIAAVHQHILLLPSHHRHHPHRSLHYGPNVLEPATLVQLTQIHTHTHQRGPLVQTCNTTQKLRLGEITPEASWKKRPKLYLWELFVSSELGRL